VSLRSEERRNKFIESNQMIASLSAQQNPISSKL
jgi:hypothetical protein